MNHFLESCSIGIRNINWNHPMRSIIMPFLGMALLLIQLTGCDTYVDRTVKLSTVPPGATVLLNGTEQNKTTPMTIDKMRWYEPKENNTSKSSHSSSNSIQLKLHDYETKTINLSYAEARNQPRSRPWVLPKITLDRISQSVMTSINSYPSGAEVIIDGKSRGSTPLKTPLRFNRHSAKDPWSSVAVMLKKNNYLAVHKDISYADALSGTIDVHMVKVQQSFTLNIESNIPDSEVQINGQTMGTTPLSHTFEFSRVNNTSPWNQFVVEVTKEGYRKHHENGHAKPGDTSPWSKVITVNDATPQTIKAELENIKYGRSLLRNIVFNGQGYSIAEDIVWAQLGEIEPEPQIKSATNITDEPAGKLMLSNISVTPFNTADGDSSSKKYQVIYTKSIDLVNSDATFSNLRDITPQGITTVTDGSAIDLDAVFSPDSKYIYFSANRLRDDKFNLWRIQTTGQGGFTKITDSESSVADIEPTVSPDGKMIAFTRWQQGAKLPQIWIKSVDGGFETQLRVGHSPAWSPDGNQIAFVAPDKQGKNQIWVMNKDGGPPTKKTTRACDHQYPTWTPDGKKIIYAANAVVINTAEDIRNWDIWMVKLDGTEPQQLTTFGSYDTQPEISDDGRYIYFFSNRNAKKDLENNWQIWRIELASKNKE